MKYRKNLDQIRSFDPPRAVNKPHNSGAKLTNLALNENSLGYSPKVATALAQALPTIFRYPTTFCGELRERLAQKYDLAADQFLFGNGIFEILSLISLVFVGEGDEVIIPEPSFGWYNISTWGVGGKVLAVPLADYTVDLKAVEQAITDRTKLIWLCNPHNPMGTIVRAQAFEEFLERVPADVPVVLDEAYAEFAEDAEFPDSIKLLKKHANLIVLRTFSKAYGLAGLRIGYAISSPETISYLHKVKTPPNVNTLAQVAALAALEDTDFLAFSVRSIRKGVQDYYEFCQNQGIPYIPTFSNFIMINVQTDGDAVAKEFLQDGIILRSGSEIGLPTWIRVTIGNDEENQRVFAVLSRIVQATRSAVRQDALPV